MEFNIRTSMSLRKRCWAIAEIGRTLQVKLYRYFPAFTGSTD